MRTTLSILALFGLFHLRCVSYAVDGGETGTTNWHQVDAGPFTFSAPPGMTNIPVQAFDSHVGEYAGTNIFVRFDYGKYNGYSFKGKHKARLDAMSSRPNFKFVEQTIGGHPAEIVSFQMPGSDTSDATKTSAAIIVHFPKVPENARYALSFHVTYQGETNYSAAKSIYESVRFR